MFRAGSVGFWAVMLKGDVFIANLRKHSIELIGGFLNVTHKKLKVAAVDLSFASLYPIHHMAPDGIFPFEHG